MCSAEVGLSSSTNIIRIFLFFYLFWYPYLAMSSEGEYFDSGEGEYVSSEEDDPYALSGDDDAFGAPRCPDPGCRGNNIHSSGSLSICLSCRSVQSSGAVVSTTDSFPYRPLVVEASELRLLLVWPPRDNQDAIYCTLIHGRLGTGIEYDAVSYTWADETGDDSQRKTVLINDLALSVTATCEAVLRRARLQSTAKVLWIDAVCINQADTNERGHQVGLMPDIYSHAKKVLIFPGEATDADSRGLYYLPELERFVSRLNLDSGSLSRGDQGEEPALDIWKTVQHTIKHLFSRRYFTRVWILQEIALAREPVVMYGAYEVPWDTIRTKITRSLERYAGSSTWSYNLARPLLPPKEPLPRALTLGSGTLRGPSDLLDLLDKARSSQAHDARDKVFALFGMIPFASGFGLVADYNQSVEQAYAKVAVLLAAQHGLLPILARTIGTTPRRVLASWVPDWSSPGWYMADKTPLPQPPKWTMEVAAEPPDSIRKILANPTKIPVLARPDNYEMEFIGAWVCDLGTLIRAGLSLQVFTLTQGVVSLKGVADLALLYRALDLPEGGSLCCYLPMSPMETATYHDEDHLERELANLASNQKLIRTADLLYQRLSNRQCEFILSSGLNEFCFAGLCVVAPSAVIRALAESGSRGYMHDNLLPDDMRRFLSTELISLVSRHRSAAKAEGAPTTSENPGQPLPTIRLGGLLAMATAGRMQGPIKSDPPGMLGGGDGWLRGWADRELRFLDELLQTAEGKAMLQDLDARIIWPNGNVFRRNLGLMVDIGFGSLLGDEPIEFRRLTLKLGE